MLNAVGIDVSKGKSTVAILRPAGEVVRKPFSVLILSRIFRIWSPMSEASTARRKSSWRRPDITTNRS